MEHVKGRKFTEKTKKKNKNKAGEIQPANLASLGSLEAKMVWKPAKSEDFSVVFDNCVVGILELAKSNCAQLLCLAERC